MQIKCPTCLTTMNVDDNQLGGIIQCPLCGKSVEVKPSDGDEAEKTLPSPVPAPPTAPAPAPAPTSTPTIGTTAQKSSKNSIRLWMFAGCLAVSLLALIASFINLAIRNRHYKQVRGLTIELRAALDMGDKDGYEAAQKFVSQMEPLAPELAKAWQDVIDTKRLGTLEDKAQAALDRQDFKSVQKIISQMKPLNAKVAKEWREKMDAAAKHMSVKLSSKNVIEMIRVEPGSFMMGSPEDEPGRYDNERQHRVTITKVFWLGKYEITHGQWKEVMDTELRGQVIKALEDDTVYSSLGNKTLRDYWGLSRDAATDKRLINTSDDVAMHYVSYEDCIEFCRRINERERKAGRLPDGYKYWLPTEAQWEYACRAGTTTALYNGPIEIKGKNNAPALDEIAWYGGNSSQGYKGWGLNTKNWEEKQYPGGFASVRNVGGKKANPWGFHDMIGNVLEWCSDWYEKSLEATEDPTGPVSGSARVYRGGSWINYARYCRSAGRWCDSPSIRDRDFGFRLALVPVQ